ncbi:SDH family Clp fold serine proteinase [Acidocella sp.]|jgi:hypothetical protein|uniref:SDH family Clp fold serine proteinase n=1 Tax=Acidocella sp. TaxID=50710 RepID=UPI002F3F4B3D
MPNDYNETASDQDVTPASSSQDEASVKAGMCKASIYQDKPFTADFSEAVLQLQEALGLKLWVLIQNGGNHFGDLNSRICQGFNAQKNAIKKDEKVGLLVHSPGGSAGDAYKIARLFQRRTNEFYTIVPLYAKSAATLLSLGGKEIIMGSEAELGPLDVQMYDDDKEDYDSALNAVQSLERLNAYALSAFDQAMFLFLSRTGKKAEIVMPMAMQYATSMVKPLVEKIDTIELTKKSRELKVAEDYAIRLMRQNYNARDYERIADALVSKYSTHSFVIDRAEAGKGNSMGRPQSSASNALNLGLNVMLPNDIVEDLFARIATELWSVTAIGQIIEVDDE